MRIRAVIVPALLAALLTCSSAAAEEVSLGAGGWSWFADPRAVTYTGQHTRTYIGWVDREGDITVESYDHATRAAMTTVLHAAFQRDDHANPSLQVRPDGRIVAYYSKHVGPELLYRVSVNPEDVSAWGPEQSVPTNAPAAPGDVDHGYTYPNPVRLAAEDSAGRPVIVFASFPSPGDHRYHYARWTGSAWDVHQITPAGGSISANGYEPQYSGGITLDHEDPSHVYLSRQFGNAWEVEAWTTSDGGTHWTSQAITTGSSDKNVRPVSSRGLVPFDSGLRVIWLRGAYNSFVTYETSLAALWGEPPIAHPPAPPSASGAPVSRPSKLARLHFSRGTVHVDRRGRAWVSVGCLAAPGDRCRISGTVWLRRVRLGRLAGALPGNVRGTVSLRLTPRGLRRLRRARRLRVRVLVVSRNTAGTATTARWSARLGLGL